MISYKCPECGLVVDTKWYLNICIDKCRYCESTYVLLYLLPSWGLAFYWDENIWSIGRFNDEEVDEDPD